MDEHELTGAWDHARLPPNVRVGERCWLERLGSFERVATERDPGLVLGDGVSVFTWTTFSIEPTGLVEVGDGCVLVGALFMCAEHIQVGQRVVVSYNVTIADCDFHPRDPELRRQDAVAVSPCHEADRPPFTTDPVVIEDDVEIGIGAIILKGVCVGRGARIEAGAVVTGDVAAGSTVAGNPARPVTGEVR